MGNLVDHRSGAREAFGGNEGIVTWAGWVFTQPNGRPIDPRADHESWKALLREANVRDARLHDARHTAATILLVLGVPTRAVMEVMGWSQMAMTTRYQHLAPGVVSGIADQVAGLLWEPNETTDDKLRRHRAPGIRCPVRVLVRWWARQVSNLRPNGYEPSALPLSYGP